MVLVQSPFHTTWASLFEMKLEPNLLDWNVNDLEGKLELEDMKRTFNSVCATMVHLLSDFFIQKKEGKFKQGKIMSAKVCQRFLYSLYTLELDNRIFFHILAWFQCTNITQKCNKTSCCIVGWSRQIFWFKLNFLLPKNESC